VTIWRKWTRRFRTIIRKNGSDLERMRKDQQKTGLLLQGPGVNIFLIAEMYIK